MDVPRALQAKGQTPAKVAVQQVSRAAAKAAPPAKAGNGAAKPPTKPPGNKKQQVPPQAAVKGAFSDENKKWLKPKRKQPESDDDEDESEDGDAPVFGDSGACSAWLPALSCHLARLVCLLAYFFLTVALHVYLASLCREQKTRTTLALWVTSLWKVSG
jgi:hypothetical protein